MLRYLNAFVLFVGFLFASSSFASIMWSSDNYNFQYSSAQQACDAIGPNYDAGGFVYKSTDSISVGSMTQDICHYTQVFPQYGYTQSAQAFIYSNGGTCDAGTTKDATNSCSAPAQADGSKCNDQTGARGDIPMVFSAAGGKCELLTELDTPALCHYLASGSNTPTYSQVPGTVNSAGELVAPPTFIAEASGCEMQTITSSNCTLSVGGASKCEVTANYTGNVNSGPKAATSAKDVSTIKQLDTKQEQTVTDTPCATAGNCSSETKTETSGSQSCGTFNGAMLCTTVNPTSSGTKVVSTTTSTVNQDDSVTATQTDNKTSTKCTNVQTCTISTSTTVTNTTTTKTGTTTTSKTCTGTCTGSTTGTATGTGEGDGADGGSANASDDCKVPPTCSGDVFQCAILRQEYLDSCAERALPTDQQKADIDAQIAKQVSNLDANQKVLDDSATTLLGQFQSAANASTGGKCFEDKTFSAMGRSIVLPFSQTCPYLEWLRYAVTAIAFLISFKMISKEL